MKMNKMNRENNLEISTKQYSLESPLKNYLINNRLRLPTIYTYIFNINI
jgi:hypothetical protein